MTPETATDRYRRIVTWATGLGTIVFTLLALPAIVVQIGLLHPLVGWPLTLLFCGIPIAMLAMSRWGSIRMIVVAARVHTAVTFALLLAWAPSMLVEGLPDGNAPWPLNMMAVATATAAIGWPARTAWVLTLGLPVVGALLRYVVLDDGWDIPIQDAASMAGFCSIVTALFFLALGLGARQDRDLANAESEARDLARVESRARALSRFGALVHDDVITVLLAAARAQRRSADVERGAQDAIRRLDRFALGEDMDATLTALQLEERVRSMVGGIIDGIHVEGTLAAFAGQLPVDAAEALLGAVAEASRNSALHAGSDVSRRLLLEAGETAISISLCDDGRGFDRAAVPPVRLGIASSIVARLDSIPGASVDIDTAVGRGTVVRIDWIPSAVEVRR